MRLITGILIVLMLFCSTARAQVVEQAVANVPVDSVPQLYSVDKLASQQWYQITSAAVPLAITGLAVIPGKTHFTDLRNDYVPDFRYKYDDYLQYAPAVVMLGLKACGYQSRSSWGRMLTSDAFSIALMMGAVNGIKYTADVQRPDSQAKNSFPSGHTATAFMTATMLHKEYGDRSPWFSVGAYTVATATGVSRILNNRHYISDVLMGAGIGILSVELGYFFADLIFKEKGLKLEPQYLPLIEKPTYLGMRMGFTAPLSPIKLSDNLTLDPGMGAQAGVEGVYFFNKYVGCGATATVSNMPVSLVEQPEVSLNAIDEARFMAGGYFNYPCMPRLSVGGKVSAGYSYISNGAVGGEAIKLDNSSFVWSAGVSVGYVLRRHFGARLFCDYTSTALSYQLSPATGLSIYESQSGKGLTHSLVWGASANILF